MTHEEEHAVVMDLAWLAACAVNGETPDRERVAGMDLAALYQTAEFHLLTGVTAMALERAGVKDAAFTQAKGKAIRKVAAFDVERAAVLDAMERAGIWYLPLKGCVMEALYPKIGMRQMSDNDILFDASRCEELRQIMESLGFSTESFGKEHHDNYFKPPVCYFEMHRTLFSDWSAEVLRRYYSDYANHYRKDAGNGFGYHFSDEDFYIFMLAHEYKHYTKSGTGIRSLLDIYVFLKKKRDAMDWRYIAEELDKLGIRDFEERNRELSLHLFEGEALTDQDRSLLAYVATSGAFGTEQHWVKNSIASYDRWGRAQYMRDRFFVPVTRKDKRYDKFAEKYPLFYRHKLLLPLLPLYRLTKSWRRVGAELWMTLFQKE